MLTPSYSTTATERVLPRLALDFTTAALDARVTITRALNTATRINASGYIEVINANLPRFDFDPVTLACKGLLIEELRSNLFLQSQAFTVSPWSNAGTGSIVDGAGTGPDNTSSAALLTPTAGSTTVLNQAVTVTATAYTLSAFVRANGITTVSFSSRDNPNLGLASFDLTTGIATVLSGGTSAVMTRAANNYWRCAVTFTPTLGASNRYRISTATGDGANGVYVYGAQLEAGAFATSYIPTTTTSLTRNADLVSMTGTNFSSWYNQSEGAFYNEVLLIGFSGAGRFGINVSDGTSNNRIMQYLDAVTALNGRYSTSGVSTTIGKTGISNMTVTPGKSVQAYKANNFAFTVNGDTVVTSASGAIPTVDRAYFNSIETGAATNMASGWLRKVMYWPQRLTNAEVQAFSK